MNLIALTKRYLTEDWRSGVIELRPCAEARPWLRSQVGGPHAAWLACERGDWLAWLCSHVRAARAALTVYHETFDKERYGCWVDLADIIRADASARQFCRNQMPVVFRGRESDRC